MKERIFIKTHKLHRIYTNLFAIAVMTTLLFSFTVHTLNSNFFKELGISKTDADKKITQSFLRGYLNVYGAKNVKNIVLGNRGAVVMDLLTYTKQSVNSNAFKKEYAELKEANKPKEYKIKTPEEMRKENIESNKKSVASMEALVLKAGVGSKALYEKMLADSKKQLKEAEDPNNKDVDGYAKNYPGLAKSFKESYQQELKKWEDQYPANHLLFVRQRLQQFLEETKGIDFSAELTNINGKKVFVSKVYEGKSFRWKMAFRAGKEVVEPARTFAEEWITEINQTH